MRNLKKVLTLVLTLAMLLSVMVVGAGAATFGDQESITNKEAVDMCVALNIIGGYEDGTFRPTGNVTRAEMCKMICVALNGGKEPTMGSNLINTFNDVGKDHWAAPYVEYCVSQGIVGGVGGGRFDPNGNITGTQAAKMLLCILGYNASIQGYVGNDFWETKINVDAAQKGLYEGLSSIDASTALNRDQAAQMIWNALNAYEVEYITTLVPGPDGTLTSKVTVQDRYDSSLNRKITLLNDKYEAASETGFLTKVPSAKQNAKGVTFTFNDADGNSRTLNFKNVTTDYSSLLGYEVKVIYNTKKVDEASAIYGVYKTNANETYEAVWKDIEADGAKVKFGGKSYTLDGNLTVYADGDVHTNWTSANFDNKALADTVLFIDNDGDSKIEAAQVKTQNVAKVTYVSGTAMDTSDLIATNKGYAPFNPYDADVALDDVIVYDGIAKDDYVKVSYNLYNDKVAYEKIDAKEATVEATRTTANNTKEIRIDGTWYKPADGYTTMPSLVSGDTIEYVAIGTLLYNVKKTDGTWGSKNLAVVYNVAEYGVGAKAHDLEISFITRDGVKKSLILDKYNNYEVTATVTPGTPDTVAWDLSSTLTSQNLAAVQTELKGKLMTYREDGNEVSLMPVSATQSAGYDEVYQLTSVTYTAGQNTLGGRNIADNAVIFLTTTNDAKVVSGKELKTAGNATYNAVTNVALGGTENGVKYVQAAALSVNAMPTVTGTNYAYVLSAAETTDDKDCRYFELWTANGKLDAYEESSDLYTYDGGEIVTYTVVSTADGRTVIKNVEEVATGNTSGTLQMGDITSDGFYGSGESKIAIAGAAYDLASDAIVLNVDTDKKEGINSENPKSGAREARNGEYNILYVTNSKGDIVFALVDGNNNKVLCETATLPNTPSVSDVNAALGSADKVSITGDLSNTDGLVVPKGKTLTVTGKISGTDAITGGGVLNVGNTTDQIPETAVITPTSITADASGKGEITLYIKDSVALKAGNVNMVGSTNSNIAYELGLPKHAGSTIARVVKVNLPAADTSTNVTLTSNTVYSAAGTIVDTAQGDLYMTIGNAIDWVKLAYTGTDSKSYEVTVNFVW